MEEEADLAGIVTISRMFVGGIVVATDGYIAVAVDDRTMCFHEVLSQPHSCYFY